MGQHTSSCFVEHGLYQRAEQTGSSLTEGSPWQSISNLSEFASAIGLPDGLLISTGAGQRSRTAIIPTADAMLRLEYAVTAARAIERNPIVIACTNGLEARYVTADKDPRDRQYLTGGRTADGFHAYCGSIVAAVRRALVYAASADVICYNASGLDFAAARDFVSALHESFPEKALGVSVPLQFWRDHVRIEEKLRQLGYTYIFLSAADTFLFLPSFPRNRLWVLVDDRAESHDAPLSASPHLGSAGTLYHPAYGTSAHQPADRRC
jgi:hypothetical protein